MSGACSAAAARIAVSIRAAVARNGHPCPDGDPGMPVIRPACSGSVIRQVVIRRASERGLVPVSAVPGAKG